jgi:hypothetical protein
VNTNMENYGFKKSKIKEFRKQNFLSSSEFIEGLYKFSDGECDISYYQFRQLENGNEKVSINPYDIAWICRYTSISPNELFNLEV